MESERIKLVKPSLELVPAVREAIFESRDELKTYLKWVQSSLDEPETNMRLAIENHTNNTGELRFIILDRKTSTVLGAVGLIIRESTVPFFEIGYWVRTSMAGKGYVTEAVALLEKYAFEVLGAKRLEIRAAKDNARSRAVAERCGFFFEAALKNERRLPCGELSDTVVYGKYGL